MLQCFILALLLSLSTAFAADYHPLPVKRSSAEIALRVALDTVSSKPSCIELCRSVIENNLEDIPAGRCAVDAMKKEMDSASLISYLKYLSLLHQDALSAQYFYARIIDDTLIWDEKTHWALATHPDNFWTHLLAMAAEWHKSKPDLEKVIQHIQHAIALDPSRPEGYFFLGSALTEQKKYREGVEACEAGLVCDPNHGGLHSAKIDAYMRLRESERVPNSPQDQAQKKLLAMLDDDQKFRRRLDSLYTLQTVSDSLQTLMRELSEKQQSLDIKNLASLEEIIQTLGGWPLISKVGREASTAAFLIIQHADTSAQNKYYSMLKNAAENYELAPNEFALFEDRVLIAQNKPQRYGSQIKVLDDGTHALFPIEDEPNVDLRRASAGLQPLRDYCKYFKFDYIPKR